MNYLPNKRYITIFTLFGFLMLALFGLSFSTIMENNMEHIGASPCPYEAGKTALCPMSTLGHIESWQEIFRVFPKMFELLVLAFVFIFAFVISKRLKQYLIHFFHFREKFYKCRELTFYNLNLLEYLFSKGLLNTKAY